MDEQMQQHEEQPVRRKWTAQDRKVFVLTLASTIGAGEALSLIAHAGWGGAAFAAAAATIIAKSSPDLYQGIKDYLPWAEVQHNVTEIINRREPGSRSIADRLMGHHPSAEEIERSQVQPIAPPLPEVARTMPDRRSLVLAHDLVLDLDDIAGKAVFIVGIRRSGKTTLGTRLAEQMGQYLIPMVLPDSKGDLISLASVLPRAVVVGHESGYTTDYRYEVVTPGNSKAFGERILARGLQVIIDMTSYSSLDDAAAVTANIIQGLFTWSRKHPEQRVPCEVFLDEAQMFLPQNLNESVIQDKATLSALLNAYMQVIAVGGALGISPVILTQRFAQVNNKIMAQSEVFFIMRQTNDNDLDRSMGYVNKAVATKEDISKFGRGQGVYIGADGAQLVTTFLKRESDDSLSRTPTSEKTTRYAHMSLTGNDEQPVSPVIDRVTFQAFEEEEQEQPAQSMTLDSIMQLYTTDKIDLATFQRLLDMIPDNPNTPASRSVPSHETEDREISSQSANLRLVPSQYGIIPVDTEQARNEPVERIPAMPGLAPMLGKDDYEFSSEQEQDFLRRYRKTPNIHTCLAQMVNSKGEIGISKRYYKHALWLVSQQQKERM